MTIQNYFTHISDDIFITIGNLLPQNTLKILAHTDTIIYERVKNLFFTLYICPRGHSEDVPYQIFFKDLFNLTACSRIVSQKKIRQLNFIFPKSLKKLPQLFVSESTKIPITSFKVYFIWGRYSINDLYLFLSEMKNFRLFNSLKRISLNPVVNEEKFPDALETVTKNAVFIQSLLYSIKTEESLEEAVFDFPTYKLTANDLQISSDSKASEKKQLQITLNDNLELLFLPEPPQDKELRKIRHIEIKFPENISNPSLPQ